jgi:hypothetical protein
VYIYNAIKMPSIIITYLVVLLVLLRLVCVIEVSSVSSLICLYFYCADLFGIFSVRIASKPCSPDGEMWVVYVLVCYCPLFLRIVEPCRIGLVRVMRSSLVCGIGGCLWLFTAVFVQFLFVVYLLRWTQEID